MLKKVKIRRKDLVMAWIDCKNVCDIILQTQIIDCQKMFKISKKVINFIMRARKLESRTICCRKTLAEEKTQRGIFLGDLLLQLLFFIPMMQLNYLLRKSKIGHRFAKSQEKINHIMYIDNMKVFGKKKKNQNPLYKLFVSSAKI